MSNSQVYLHIGLHKTGTTTLQDSVFPHLQDCHYHKYHSFLPQLRRFSKNDPIYAEGRELKSTMRGMLKDGKNVFSAELFTSSPLLGYQNQSGILKLLKEVFPDGKLILVLREQSDWLRSFYKHMVKHGYRGGINSIIIDYDKPMQGAYISPESLEYHKLVEFLFELFGKENVLVCFYEDLKKDKAGFVDQILRFIGVTADFDSLSSARNKGIGYSELFLAILKQLNRLRHSNYHRGFMRFRPRILNLINSILPSVKMSYFNHFKSLKSDYRESNLDLETILGREIPKEYKG